MTARGRGFVINSRAPLREGRAMAVQTQCGARDTRPIYLTPYTLYGAANQIKFTGRERWHRRWGCIFQTGCLQTQFVVTEGMVTRGPANRMWRKLLYSGFHTPKAVTYHEPTVM